MLKGTGSNMNHKGNISLINTVTLVHTVRWQYMTLSLSPTLNWCFAYYFFTIYGRVICPVFPLTPEMPWLCSSQGLEKTPSNMSAVNVFYPSIINNLVLKYLWERINSKHTIWWHKIAKGSLWTCWSMVFDAKLNKVMEHKYMCDLNHFNVIYCIITF